MIKVAPFNGIKKIKIGINKTGKIFKGFNNFSHI